MKLSFRQGIARYQTDVNSNPIFLQRSSGSGNFVDLLVSPDPTILVFAHKRENYIVEEVHSVTQAWGPFAGNQTAFLYWDINLLTGELTRGVTLFEPTYSGTPPSNPAVDQHWFNTTDTTMRVWNGTKWAEKIRVFAGKVTSSAIIHPYPLGSQAGITGDFEGGNIVLDSYNKPLRQSDSTFVTSSTSLIIVNNSAKKVKFEAEVLTGMAAEPVPKFSLVQMRAGRQIVNNRSSVFTSRIAGIVTEDLYLNEVGYVIPDGLVQNDLWNFPNSAVNRPIFSGPNGEVTTTPPTSGVCQVAGYVYDTDAVYINVQPPIILDDIYSDLPAAAPTDPITPISSFYASTTSGTAPFSVTFTSTSQGNPTAFEWDFDNDGNVDATGAIATHVFQEPGTYSVRLRAINSFGFNDHTIEQYIIVREASNTVGGTNIGVRLGGPAQVMSNRTFQMSISVSNDGTLPATQVTRQLIVPDVNGTQISVSGLPDGSTQTRSGSRLIVELPNITTIPAGQTYGPIMFSITAPPRAGRVTVQATVSSPEADPTLGDNTTSMVVEVKA